MHRAVFAFLLLLPAALAQTTGTAVLVGTVTDNTGAVVPGAPVTLVNTGTSFVYNGQTNTEGNYYVPNLIPGTYRLTIEVQGFKRFIRDGIILRTSEQPRIDVQLEVGAVTESIQVTGAPPLLETETTATGQILEGETIIKIPVLQKYAFRILLYLPSTSNINGQHVVGQRERAMGYTMDGVSGKEPVRGMVGATNQVTSTTIDALQEVKLFTTGMPAEFGHSAGGLLSTVFKSGTNTWHGSAEDRYIQKALIHRNYLEQLPRVNPFGYHELSATMGGPIYIPKVYNGKDKTFWFFGFQRHHEKASETFTGAVPSPEMLAGNFNFGGLNPIYDPASTGFGPSALCATPGAECWSRQPFPNNVIPQSRFDPAVRNFLNLNIYRPQNNPDAAIDRAFGPTNNLIAPTKYRSWRTRFDGKIDHQFAPQHKMFGRYSHVRHRSWRDRYSPEIQKEEFDWRAVPIPIDQRNVVISDTYTLSPTLINELRLGYNRRRGTVFPATLNQDWAGKLGIPNASPAVFPHFQGCNNQSNCTGGTTYFRQNELSASQDVGEDFTFQNNVTKIVAKHTVKFGYELLRTRYNSLVASNPTGTYRFGGTDFPFRANTGNTFAAFLLGSVSNAVFTQSQTTWLPRWWSHAWYIQDDFKVKRNVTLNLGLRWSYESPFQTKYGFQSQFDPTATDPITGRRGAILHPKGPLASKDLNNFQPRVGLAWQIAPTIVFRSSFGLITQDLFTNGLSQNFEEYFATANIQAPPGDPRPVFYLSQGPPRIQFNVLPDGSVPFVGTNFAGRPATWFDPNMRMPYIMNWSGGFQWNFTQNWLLETTYQGSRGVRLQNAWNINQVPLNIASTPAGFQPIFQAQQNFRPFPHFGNISHVANYGDNSYHGVTFRTEKRYSHGLVLNAFYTFSKSLNNGDNDGSVSGADFFNRALEKGRANYDIRHRFVSVMTYELPFGRGRKFLNKGGIVNHLLGGWDLAWTQTFQSGPPITVTFAGSPFNYLPGAGQLRSDVVPGVNMVTPNWSIGPHRFPVQAQVPYLNAQAFAYPAAFTPGTMGRNIIEAPGLTWPQFSLSKEWRIYESLRFILRWDSNNPFKSPNFGNPNSAYNLQNLGNFGRVGTSTRGGFSDIGTGSPNHLLVFRLEW